MELDASSVSRNVGPINSVNPPSSAIMMKDAPSSTHSVNSDAIGSCFVIKNDELFRCKLEEDECKADCVKTKWTSLSQ